MPLHSAIRYAVNLHEHHGVDLSSAYASAVAQFRALRSELQVARTIALSEAEHNGVEFGPSQVDIQFEKEEKAYDTFRTYKGDSAGAVSEQKRWKAVIESPGPTPRWTKGQEYTRLWKKGVRPVYAPVLEEPEIKPEGLDPEAVAKRDARLTSAKADFVGVLPRSARAAS